MKVAGKINQVKKVNVRGSEHTVVLLKKDDQSIAADLGRTKDLKDLNLRSGQDITVIGPKSMVGDKALIVAQSLTAGDQDVDINRKRPEVQGEVVETRQAKVRGRQHLIATIKSQKGNKVAVDLGPQDRLGMQVKKGDQLTITGAPVKIKGKRMVLAQSIEHDGKTVQIDRRKKSQQS